MNTHKRRVTVFDFDGTLIKGDSFVQFAVKAVGKRRLCIALIGCLVHIAAWKIGLIDGSVAKMRLFKKLYCRMPYELFRNYGEEFASYIDKDLRADIFAEFQRCLKQGDTMYIISASVRDWIEPWAHRFEGVRVCATEAEVHNGFLTGRFCTANCKGWEKVRRLRDAEPMLDKSYLTVYSDNKSDKPLMDIASDAIKV